MSTEWLSIQSFQYDQDLLTAINTLSIHVKLNLLGETDEKRLEAAQLARQKLDAFFRKLEPIIQEAEQAETEPLLGTDPRLRQFAKGFIAAKRNRQKFRSTLFRDTITRVHQLLYSNEESDQKVLILCLQELRTLLEEHIHTDSVRILGGK